MFQSTNLTCQLLSADYRILPAGRVVRHYKDSILKIDIQIYYSHISKIDSTKSVLSSSYLLHLPHPPPPPPLFLLHLCLRTSHPLVVGPHLYRSHSLPPNKTSDITNLLSQTASHYPTTCSQPHTDSLVF